MSRIIRPEPKPAGLFREELIGSRPARTTGNIFANLPHVNRGELIADDPVRRSQGTRLLIDRTQGTGTWEFYRLESDLYLLAADCVYDTARVETVPGEGLVEFHLRLSGELRLRLPGRREELVLVGPRLLILYQPPGVDYSEQVVPQRRDTCVSLYCRPQFLADIVRRNGIRRCPVLEDIERHHSPEIWHRVLPLSSGLTFVARSLLDNPFRKGVRLLHAEAKALDLLCEVLHVAEEGVDAYGVVSEREVSQLEAARRILSSEFAHSPSIPDIARTVGMSPSKLKRAFKSRFGVTVFEYGFECRMRHALQLLRGQHSSVGQVAYTVGYGHQTSFTAAFKNYYGFSPREARTKVH
jgi:AraC-like DNA-binding protein